MDVGCHGQGMGGYYGYGYGQGVCSAIFGVLNGGVSVILGKGWLAHAMPCPSWESPSEWVSAMSLRN